MADKEQTAGDIDFSDLELAEMGVELAGREGALPPRRSRSMLRVPVDEVPRPGQDARAAATEPSLPPLPPRPTDPADELVEHAFANGGTAEGVVPATLRLAATPARDELEAFSAQLIAQRERVLDLEIDEEDVDTDPRALAQLRVDELLAGGVVPQPVDDAPTTQVATLPHARVTTPARGVSPALAALARAVATPPESTGEWLSPAQTTKTPPKGEAALAARPAAEGRAPAEARPPADARPPAEARSAEPRPSAEAGVPAVAPAEAGGDDEMELDGAELEDVDEPTPVPARPERARSLTPFVAPPPTPAMPLADAHDTVAHVVAPVPGAAAPGAPPAPVSATAAGTAAPPPSSAATPSGPIPLPPPPAPPIAVPSAAGGAPVGPPAPPAAGPAQAAPGSGVPPTPPAPSGSAAGPSPPGTPGAAPPPPPVPAASAAGHAPPAHAPPAPPGYAPPAPPGYAPPAPPAHAPSAHAPSPPSAPAAAPAGAPAPEVPLRPRRKRRAKQWFEEIFDDDYLRTLPFLTPRQTEREAQFIAESLQIPVGGTLLDLACGYGRHAMELAAKGYKVTGLDLSLPLLIRAADAARRVAVNVNFIHGDMREMTFENEFDGAYCMFTSFGYFDDDTNRKVAANLARAIKPGGKLLLDVANRDYLCRDLPTRVWWQGDGCVVLEEVDFNYFSSRLQVQRSIIFEDGRQVEQEISIRAYSLHEIGKILHHSGFRVTEVSGGLSLRGKFFGGNSRQLIVVAEKKPQP